MIGRIGVIALNTYRESVRARILIGLAGVAFAVSIYSIIVASFTLDSAPRVVADLGSASISIFAVAVAIIIGATSLHRELEQKTIFPILARPITRTEYLVGKYLGTLLTLAVFILADTGLVLLLVTALGKTPPAVPAGAAIGSVLLLILPALRYPKLWTFGPIPWAFGLCAVGFVLSADAPYERQVIVSSSALALLEIVIVAAVATFFSSFSTPFLSALLTLGIFVVGRSADALAKLPVKQFGQTLHDLGVALSKVVPNLQTFVPARPLLAGEVVDANLGRYVALAALMALAWAVGLLAASSAIFARRDFL